MLVKAVVGRVFPCCTMRGAVIADDAEGTPTQSHISPSIIVFEDTIVSRFKPRGCVWFRVERGSQQERAMVPGFGFGNGLLFLWTMIAPHRVLSQEGESSLTFSLYADRERTFCRCLCLAPHRN